jgi:hypothetical protein
LLVGIAILTPEHNANVKKNRAPFKTWHPEDAERYDSELAKRVAQVTALL